MDDPARSEKRSSGLLMAGKRIDMRQRIDHIFLSDDLEVIEAHYLPTPESQTDHPAHWALVQLKIQNCRLEIYTGWVKI